MIGVDRCDIVFNIVVGLTICVRERLATHYLLTKVVSNGSLM